MIHLITLNPAIDQYIEVDNFSLGTTSYRSATKQVMGGKAVNVAKVLTSLRQRCTLVTTVDNSNRFVTSNLEAYNAFLIEVDSIRTNLKINDRGQITEINDRGKALNSLAKLKFENYINKCVEENDIVLIAGNPHPDDEQFQYKLAKLAKHKRAKLFLDSNRFTFSMIKELEPDFIKPNDEELEYLDITAAELIQYTSELIVSHGGEGFTYYGDGEIRYEAPIKGTVVNTVGAGDSLVAGYIYATANKLDLEERLLIAKYAASATVYSGEIATRVAIEVYDTTNILK